MKLCYCDESGTGDESIAVMAGIVVDSQRMHITKQDWRELLSAISKIAGREITELHTRHFYSGRKPFSEIDGQLRAKIIGTIFDWLRDRRHLVLYAAVNKQAFGEAAAKGKIPTGLDTVWRFPGFHMVLGVQKMGGAHEKTKGHTILVFDNEDREAARFADLIVEPPAWSGSYYGFGKGEALDQIVDVPYFGDSRHLALIQVADFVAYFLRRYAEIKEGSCASKYEDEEGKLEAWVAAIRSCAKPNLIYPRRGRNSAHDLFFRLSPPSLRDL